MPEFIISDQAEQDLVRAIDFLAAVNPRAADDLLDELITMFQILAGGDLHGPKSILKTGQLVQSWPVPPYRIYYQWSPEETIIVRVHHQARRPIE